MQTPHILIVEDELVTRNTLKSIFEAEGYDVFEATDGAEMHQILSENDINLVIMDINLPGKNGLLLARELRSVKARCGNEAIYGGSYGWASAGRFHHAQSQLHRFLKGFGGYTASTNTYSSAAGERILPHILGPLSPLHRQHTHFSELARECQLFVAIGGLPLRNAQVNGGGANDHMLQYWLDKMQANGTRFINISPVRNDLSAVPDAEWLAIRPGTDTALLLALSYRYWRARGARVLHAGKWLALLPVLFAVWEGLTAKTAVLPVPFFAPPQALIEVLHDDWPRLLDSLLHSVCCWVPAAGSSPVWPSAGRNGLATGCIRCYASWGRCRPPRCCRCACLFFPRISAPACF